MFYFQTLLNQALGGIDSTGIISVIANSAYAVLLLGFLVGVYQAVLRGGDVQALGVCAIKYVAVAVIIANWGTVFHDLNYSFNSLAEFIGSNSGDVFVFWDKQLVQQFGSSNISGWDIISGDIAALISVLLIVVAYLFYVISIVLFSFFYTLYGAVLYVLGPLVLAFLPIAGIGQISKSFATNVMIWNSWGIIYSIFGALITAIHMNQISDGFGNFLGFFQGPVDSIFLGMISIFYALAICVIPFIARRIICGDVGSTAISLVRAAGAMVGVGLATAAGAAAGAAPTATSAGSGSSGATLAVAPAASSSMPPPVPSFGQAIRGAMVSALSGNASPAASPDSSGGARAGSGVNVPPSDGGDRSSHGSVRNSNSVLSTFRPQGVAQQLAYQSARTAARVASKTRPTEE